MTKKSRSLTEALHIVNQTISELEERGFKVKRTSRKNHGQEDSKVNDEIEKGNRLPSNKWQNINIKAPAIEEMKYLFKVEQEIRDKGIAFDTGYNLIDGTRDWELDWSFRLIENRREEEKIAKRENKLILKYKKKKGM